MKGVYPFRFLDRLPLLALRLRILTVVLIYVVTLPLFFYFRLRGVFAYTSFAILLVPLLLGSLPFEMIGGLVHGMCLAASLIILETIINLKVIPGLYQSLTVSLEALWFSSVLMIWVSATVGYLNYRQRRERETLQEMIYIDHLTGLYNDRCFHEKLREQEERAKRYEEKFSLLCIDLDNFQKMTKTYGLRAGNELLKEFAELIKANTRKVDLLFRYVSHKFMILLPHTPPEGAKVLAEKLRRLVEENLFRKRGVTISVGVVSYEKDSDTMKTVDDIMYQVEQLEKNRVYAWDD